MKAISNELRKTLIFTTTTDSTIGWIVYLYKLSLSAHPWARNTLSELGEGIGEIGLWLILFIYARTGLKLVLGKGALLKRILPEHSFPIDANLFQKLIYCLDHTRIYFGIGAVLIILLHIALMRIPMHILFFPEALLLVVWQGVFAYLGHVFIHN